MVTRARHWLIAAAATATMFVLIVGVGNPGVTRSIFDHNADRNGFGSAALQSFTAYAWDVTKLGNDQGRLYLAGVLVDVAVLVLVFLLVAAVAAGRGSFIQVFVGTWLSVIVATLVAGYVRPAVVDSTVLGATGQTKAMTVFFSASSPGASLLFASIVFGVVVALVAAVVAVATRREEGVDEPGAGWAGGEQQTMAMPPVEDDRPR